MDKIKTMYKIKTVYSDESIGMINRAKIDRLQKECHILRYEAGLKALTYGELLIYALKMYRNKRLRILRNKKRKEEVKKWKEEKNKEVKK